jgi:hypothetical protein
VVSFISSSIMKIMIVGVQDIIDIQYLNVWLKDTAIFGYYPVTVFKQILPHIDTIIRLTIKEHN